MDFRVLGPLEVADESGRVPLGGARQRAVLAILLLHRNEVVSRDRLIEDTWEELAPPSASHTLDTYVSRLRGALRRGRGSDRLITRSPGYVLRVEREELDLLRLESHIQQGRGALASGDADSAVRILVEAAALFRGEPLEDLAYFSFAQSEIHRINELRLTVLELRLDAELSQGRHAELIGQLRSLASAYPLRERFAAQLIIALYRAGRQSEALGAFADIRRRLANEYGIDPGRELCDLQTAILHQDRVLEMPSDRSGATKPADVNSSTANDDSRRLLRTKRTPSRRNGILIAGALATIVAVLSMGLVAGGGDPAPRAEEFAPGMAILDAHSGKQTAVIPLSRLRSTGRYAYADGHFWLISSDDIDRLVEIDSTTGEITSEFPSVSRLDAYAVGDGHVWELRDEEVVRVDASNGLVETRFPLPKDAELPGGQASIAIANGYLWVTRGGRDEVLKIDPPTGEVVRRYLGVPAGVTIAIDGRTAWVVSNFRRVFVLDLTSGVVTPVRVPIGPLQYVAAGAGYGWVTDESRGIVYKIDRSGVMVATYRTGQGARPMSFSGRDLWVANQDEGTVSGIDAITGSVRTISFGHPTPDVAAGNGRVLVRVSTGRSYEDAIDALRGRVARLVVEPYQLAMNDPALDRTHLAFQVEYATCASLLRYGDVDGPNGRALQPEIARSMPIVSHHRRTYTFVITPDYRFSPPSNQVITAETLRFSLERALSPEMPRGAPGPERINDIVGERAFRSGRADHILGVQVQGDRLSIALTEASPDFLQRLTLPFFCPVPIGTPIGVPDVGAAMRWGAHLSIPSAGPYYIADFVTGEYMILRRNPNYVGGRPRSLDAVALREGIDPGRAVSWVEDGSWDGVLSVSDPILAPGGALARKWGPGSDNAESGNQRYFPSDGVRLRLVETPSLSGSFLGERVGCTVFPPHGYGVDIAALCFQ